MNKPADKTAIAEKGGTTMNEIQTTDVPRKANESFLYYASNLKVIEQLPRDVQPRANMAIIEYGAGREISNPIIVVDGYEVDLRKYLRHVFDGIDTEKRRFANKKRINEMIEKATQVLEMLIISAPSKEYSSTVKTGKVIQQEMFIKDLKKLYVKATKSDIKDIEQSINNLTPDVFITTIREHLSEFEQEKIVADYFYDVAMKKIILTQPEYNQVKAILQNIAETKKAKKKMEEERANRRPR